MYLKLNEVTRIGIKKTLEKVKLIKKGKEVYQTLNAVKKSKDTMGGMSLVHFINRIRKDTKNTLEMMSDDEFKSLFNHEDIKKLFKVMPKLKRLYEKEKEKRNI